MKDFNKMSYKEKMGFLGKMTEAELDKFADDVKFHIASGASWNEAKDDKELMIEMIVNSRMDYDRCPKCNDIFCTINYTKDICHSCIMEDIFQQQEEYYAELEAKDN